MTAIRQEQRQSAPEYTAEDVERLARDFMRWKPGSEVFSRPRLGRVWHDENDDPAAWMFNAGHDPWNPFVDARHDLQVLERAREVWRPKTETGFVDDFHAPWNRFCRAVPHLTPDYTVGSFARAVLEVLRPTETTPTGGQEFPA